MNRGEAVSPFMNQPRKPSSIISMIVYGLNKPTQTQGEIKKILSLNGRSIKKKGGGQFFKASTVSKKKKKKKA